MADSAGKRKKPPDSLGLHDDVIAEYEEDAMERAMKAISTLEAALAAWDMARDKPIEYSRKFEQSRLLYNALRAWAQKMAKARGRKSSYSERMRLLTQFVDICKKNRDVD